MEENRWCGNSLGRRVGRLNVAEEKSVRIRGGETAKRLVNQDRLAEVDVTIAFSDLFGVN